MKVIICFVATIVLVSGAALDNGKQHVLKHAAPRLTDTRIVGGDPTTIAYFPYQVSLRYRNIFTPHNPFAHNCGGSILNATTILTAAHCVIARVKSQFKIVAGTSLRRGMDGVIVLVDEIVMHENYNPDTYDNDVALMFLSSPLPIDNITIGAIELVDREYKSGTMTVITGWGALVQGGAAPEDLQVVKVPTISKEECASDYDEEEITAAMLCAGYRGVGGKDACQGDSGGPLAINGKLAGVVSWGYGCAQPRYPGVYADVYNLLPWINKNRGL